VSLGGLFLDNIEKNEQTDADILQCKADIFKVSKNKKQQQEIKKQEKSSEIETNEKVSKSEEAIKIVEFEGKKADLSEKNGGLKVEKTKRFEDIVPKRQAKDSESTSEAEIPKFDLAREILSEQRKKIAQKRRKAIKVTEDTPEKQQPQVIERQAVTEVRPELITQERQRLVTDELRAAKTDIQPLNNISVMRDMAFTIKNKVISEIVARDIKRYCAE